MTLLAVIAMFFAMVSLAIIPDASTMAVAARSLSSGLKQAVIVIVGIVTGDLILILIAVFGLSVIAETMEYLFIVIRYLGVVFLLMMSFVLFRQQPEVVELDDVEESSSWQNFLCGLLITLGDAKAILFYISFLPAFIDLSEFRLFDVGIVLATAIVALCCTKLVYAFMADRSRSFFKSKKARKYMNTIAGTVMLLTAVFILIKT